MGGKIWDVFYKRGTEDVLVLFAFSHSMDLRLKRDLGSATEIHSTAYLDLFCVLIYNIFFVDSFISMCVTIELGFFGVGVIWEKKSILQVIFFCEF